MEAGAVNDIVDIMSDAGHRWDAFLIQEGPTHEVAGGFVIEGGHLFYVGAPGRGRTVCILLHRRWSHAKLSFIAPDSRVSYLDLQSDFVHTRLVSAHLPHSEHPDDMYEVSLDCLEAVVQDSRRKGFMNIVGLDANATVGPRHVTDDPNIIGEYGCGVRTSRGITFVAWLHGQRLTAASTKFEASSRDAWTHQLWSTGAQRQIDFLLCDEIKADSVWSAAVLCALDGKSDHRPVACKVRLEP
jgi:hypothetical protein